MDKVLTGLDRFAQDEWKRFEKYRLGLLANHASLDSSLRPAKEIITKCLPGHLKAVSTFFTACPFSYIFFWNFVPRIAGCTGCFNDCLLVHRSLSSNLPGIDLVSYRFS